MHYYARAYSTKSLILNLLNRFNLFPDWDILVPEIEVTSTEKYNLLTAAKYWGAD
jgi:hypothetical protein